MKITNQIKKLLVLTITSLGIIASAIAQGPNAPEAAAFEPVDATDMVNLLTGDFTYVLPILNVPSPEGGYPIALSYHAGIAMDQEASWVGLGWSLNPGAINRGVNGYPDDWKNGDLQENFFDVGGTETETTITTSYTSIGGAWSVANSYSYNSNKGFGGSVSFGYGYMDSAGGYVGVGGSLGVSPGGQFNGSINAGYTNANGGKIGGSIGTNGAGISAGFNNIGVGLNTDGSLDLSYGSNGNSVGVSLSSKGISTSVSAFGNTAGQNISFINSASSGDYTQEVESKGVSISVPTPIGVFGLGYNKQKVRWYLNTAKVSYVSGILYLGDAVKYQCEVRGAFSYIGVPSSPWSNIYYVDSPSECNCNLSPTSVSCTSATLVSVDIVNGGKYFMDTNEVGITNGSTQINSNNAMFPALDSYSVTAQGISGSITPKIRTRGALLGLSRNHADASLFKANYKTSFGAFQNWGFNAKVDFLFTNQYSSSFSVDPNSFINNTSASSIYQYISNTGTNLATRKRDGRFVSYFTIKEIINGTAAQKGLLLPANYNFSIPEIIYHNIYNPALSEDGIGAFMITAPDGKTYHYSLPVYNNHTATRTIGVINNKPERESYFETNQGKYATHWLLTAITGPGGYFVKFSYGKWSDNDVWKAPYGEEYDVSVEDPNIKTKTFGRKELYYLDRIKTRTHTAIFVKNVRNDDLSEEWERHEFSPLQGVIPSSDVFDLVRWNIPVQKPLRLEKIIIVKNEDDLIDKTYGSSLASPGTIWSPFDSGTISSSFDYNLHTNVIDIYDNISETLAKAIKVIDFTPHYNYSLVNGTPNSSSGRLTLNGLTFKGKGGEQIMPPYKFDYLNNRSFDFDKKDLWGFHEDDPKVWSLNKITTPTGGTININYEPDDYEIAAAETARVFNRHLKFTFFSDQLPTINYVPERIQIKVEVDNQDTGTVDFQLSDYFDPNETFHFDMWTSISRCDLSPLCPPLSVSLDMQPQNATIISLDTSNNSMIIEVEAVRSSSYVNLFTHASSISFITGSNGYNENMKKPRPLVVDSNNFSQKNYSLIHTIISNKRPDAKVGGGLRVRELSINEGANTYKTHYSYNTLNSNEDQSDPNYISSGVISYQPFEKGSTQTIAYGSELPSPVPMYEYVTVKNNYNSSNGYYLDKSIYKFKVLSEKDNDAIRFGDLFEISCDEVFDDINTSQNKKVIAKRIEIKNNLACLGQILEAQRFNNKDQLLSKTVNTYAPAQEITQGVVKESYETYKEIDYVSSGITDEWLISSSKRISYPSVLKSTTISQGSFNATTFFDRHDPITGMLLETTTENSKGIKIKTNITPAYTIPEYSTGVYSMGPKLTEFGTFDNRKKNMLTQVAANKTFLDDNGVWKPISVGITTWYNGWKGSFFIGESFIEGFEIPASQQTWRKHKTYIWDGSITANGTYDGFVGDFDNFDWSLGDDVIQFNFKWKNIRTVTKYNAYRLPLEVKDVNGNYACTKMESNIKILMTSNSRYYESYYEGGEYLESILASADVFPFENIDVPKSDVYAHTGNYSIIISENDLHGFLKVGLPANNHRSGRYKVSIWVLKGANNEYLNTRFQKDENSPELFNGETVFAGDWVQLNHYFERTESDVLTTSFFKVKSASGTIYVDDFRMHPIASGMTSYVYNEWDELEYILGSNNLATKFEYDSQGRLTRTYTEIVDTPAITGGFKITNENDYHYKYQN